MRLKSLLLPPLAFAATTIAQAQTYFPPIGENSWETVDPSALGYHADSLAALDQFLEGSNSDAFLLLKDGRIVHEAYYNDFEPDQLHLWNSSGKSLNAVLVGTLVANGDLDLDAPVSDYLGDGWTSCDLADERRITVRHMLTMTSGLSPSGADNCTDAACLSCEVPPDTRWDYNTAATTLLLGVIESASGQTLNRYTREALQSSTGISGLWREVGYNRTFASTARVFARWGLLMTNDFAWDGAAIVDEGDYVSSLTNPSQTYNPSYGYLFWLNGQDSYRLPGIRVAFPGPLSEAAPQDAVFSLGKNGQIAAAYASDGLTWVRFGSADASAGSLVGAAYANEIAGRVARLAGTSSVLAKAALPSRLALYPNPTHERLIVAGETELVRVEVLDELGREVSYTAGLAEDETSVDVTGLPGGVYVVRAYDSGGMVGVATFVKE